MYAFRWNDWNLEHATRHGVSARESEAVVGSVRRPFPERIGEGKLLFVGRGQGGRFVEVICVPDEDGTLYVIHARPLTPREKHRALRRMK